ncbi:MAG TPA: hypothetical protein VN672_01595 [Solirubrobacteraceae bacterium]|nr:hypothetical protein [Solirubrobacteraceae bacterium]
MDIEIAGRPQTIDGDEEEVAVRIPLSGLPDELLVRALERSPPVTSFCERIEPGERELVVFLKDEGVAGLDTLLTAIQALLASTNEERARQSMSKAELRAEAVRVKRKEADAELRAWWEQRG